MNWIGETTFPFSGDVSFLFEVLFSILFFLFCVSSDAVILLVCRNALRKVRVSKRGRSR